MTKARLDRLGLAAALALTTLAAVPAVAAEGETFKNILGEMGIVPKDREQIHYRERAPLVMPPKMQLREPQSAESFASANPNWPKDPEVVARQKRAEADKVPGGQSDLYRLMDKNPLLTQEEMRRSGRVANGGGTSDPSSHYNDAQRDRSGFFASLFGGNDPAPAPVEEKAPVRRTLTDPPTALRQNNGKGGTDWSARRQEAKVTESTALDYILNPFRRDDDD